MFKREDGFIDWQVINSSMNNLPISPNLFRSHLKTAFDFLKLSSKSPLETIRFINRSIKALNGYPGVWTKVKTNKGEKRLKIHKAIIKDKRLVLESVQLEGYDKSTFNQIKNIILLQ